MASKTPTSATAIAKQNPEDTFEQYEKYLNAGRSLDFIILFFKKIRFFF